MIRNILDVKSLHSFKMQLNKLIEEKTLRDVQFQDMTTGSLCLNRKVPKVFLGKCPLSFPTLSFWGTFRIRIKIVSSRHLVCPCMAILVGLGLFVHGEIIQYGCYPVDVYLVHPLTRKPSDILPRCQHTWPSPGYSCNSAAAIG